MVLRIASLRMTALWVGERGKERKQQQKQKAKTK